VTAGGGSVRGRGARVARSLLASARAQARGVADRVGTPAAYRRLRAEHDQLRATYETWVPPGHFYSPYPDLDEYERRVAALVDRDRRLLGIDLREKDQLALLDELVPLVADAPFPEHRPEGDAEPEWRYWYDNFAYAYGDGIVLHGMLRRLAPRRVVEVGSGFSSAMMLDTIDGWLAGTEVTFVEPYPELLESLLRPGDEARITIHRQAVQDVGDDVFAALEAGDVLFVDSTHVVKAGSDVNHLMFEVFPHLAPGVWIHLHDIFYPFEYPPAWVREGRAWHEAYLLRAFLTFNPDFAIRWFQDFLWQHHGDALRRLPGVSVNSGGNIWLERVG
jgi:predicted O-methyltransferase YrrM